MKRTLIAASLLVAMAACNDNTTNGKPVNKDSVDNAKKMMALKDSANFTTMKWTDADTTNKNMGDVKKGQTIEITYHFTNTGDKPLVISSVQPGCGCTVADKPEAPIAPGSEGKIVGKFNSENQSPGVHEKNIIVRANTKPMTDHILLFKVNVK